jgi:hypothetical protein
MFAERRTPAPSSVRSRRAASASGPSAGATGWAASESATGGDSSRGASQPTAGVVDTSTGRDLHDGPLGGGAVSVDALAFSADGAILAAATVRGRGIPLGEVAIPGAFDFSTLAFDREGRQLAVATAGGALSIVDVDVGSWLARACALAGRDLTPEEWLRHVGDECPQAPVCDRRS